MCKVFRATLPTRMGEARAAVGCLPCWPLAELFEESLVEACSRSTSPVIASLSSSSCCLLLLRCRSLSGSVLVWQLHPSCAQLASETVLAEDGATPEGYFSVIPQVVRLLCPMGANG